MIERLVGQTLNASYRILEPLASGGFGRVYLGRDVRSNAVVAIKILHSDLSSDPALVRRFFREARAVRKITDPHLVRVLHSGRDDDICFLVMEYVAGRTLAQIVKARGPLPVEEAIRYVDQVLQALQVLHRHGVVHRDVKPQNVMVTPEGTVKLMDLGIAKSLVDGTLTAQDGRLTQSGAWLGTPQYMAPEQVRAEAVDARADLYAASIVLYELLAGKPPFQGKTAWEVLHQQVNVPPPPLEQVRADLPPALPPYLQRALEKEPARRFQSAAEMRAALSDILIVPSSDGVPSVELEPVADLPLNAAAGPAANAGGAVLVNVSEEPLVPPVVSPVTPGAEGAREPAEPAEPSNDVLVVDWSDSPSGLDEEGSLRTTPVLPKDAQTSSGEMAAPLMTGRPVLHHPLFFGRIPRLPRPVPVGLFGLTVGVLVVFLFGRPLLSPGAGSDRPVTTLGDQASVNVVPTPVPSATPVQSTPTAISERPTATTDNFPVVVPTTKAKYPATPTPFPTATSARGDAVTLPQATPTLPPTLTAAPRVTDTPVSAPTRPALPSPTSKPVPTSRPTATSQPTATVTAYVAGPAATATPTPGYSTPVLGSANVVPGAVILSWSYPGHLGADDYFDVRVWQDGRAATGIANVQTTSYTIGAGFPGGTYNWTIALIHKSGGAIQTVSVASQTGRFIWASAGGGGGGGSGGGGGAGGSGGGGGGGGGTGPPCYVGPNCL
jgi:serine/threonine-protein kinase